MTIELIFREFELLLSDIAFAGLHNTQPIALRKMNEIRHALEEMQMQEGCGLIDRFAKSLTAYHMKEAYIGEPANDFCALEFYVKTVLGNLKP